jgi:uncharacterized protein involved in type VI secretion and phage assembly
VTEPITDILAQGRSDGSGGRIYGVVPAVVTNNQDPDNLARVKVRFPWLSDDVESWWARVAAPAASDGAGVYFLPNVDDEVLVAFEHGDVRYPYVLGCLWSNAAQPPETNGDGANAMHTIETPAGHIVRLDDTDGGEKIEVIAAGGDNKVTIEKSGAITIEATGDVSITTSGGKLKLEGSSGVEISSDGAIELRGSQDVTVQASTQLVLKGATVAIN